MKKRILAIGLGTVLTLAMLTGCGKDEKLANTDFGAVTQEEIHQIAEEHHVDENIITEIVEELTEEQKLERDLKNLVRDGVNAVYGQDLTKEIEPDWDWVDKHFSGADTIGTKQRNVFTTYKKRMKEEYENHKSNDRATWYGIIYGFGGNIEKINWDTFKFHEWENEVSMVEPGAEIRKGTNVERHNWLIEKGMLDDELIEAEVGRYFHFEVWIEGYMGEVYQKQLLTIEGEIIELDGEFYITHIKM